MKNNIIAVLLIIVSIGITYFGFLTAKNAFTIGKVFGIFSSVAVGILLFGYLVNAIDLVKELLIGGGDER